MTIAVKHVREQQTLNAKVVNSAMSSRGPSARLIKRSTLSIGRVEILFPQVLLVLVLIHIKLVLGVVTEVFTRSSVIKMSQTLDGSESEKLAYISIFGLLILECQCYL